MNFTNGATIGSCSHCELGQVHQTRPFHAVNLAFSENIHQNKLKIMTVETNNHKFKVTYVVHILIEWYPSASRSLAKCSGVGTVRCGLLMLHRRYYRRQNNRYVAWGPLNERRTPGQRRRGQWCCYMVLVRSWSVRHTGPIIVSCVVTNGVGCDVARLL